MKTSKKIYQVNSESLPTGKYHVDFDILNCNCADFFRFHFLRKTCMQCFCLFMIALLKPVYQSIILKMILGHLPESDYPKGENPEGTFPRITCTPNPFRPNTNSLKAIPRSLFPRIPNFGKPIPRILNSRIYLPRKIFPRICVLLISME